MYWSCHSVQDLLVPGPSPLFHLIWGYRGQHDWNWETSNPQPLTFSPVTTTPSSWVSALNAKRPHAIVKIFGSWFVFDFWAVFASFFGLFALFSYFYIAYPSTTFFPSTCLKSISFHLALVLPLTRSKISTSYLVGTTHQPRPSLNNTPWTLTPGWSRLAT